MPCGRCGKESNELHTFRPGGNAKRERLCDGCYTAAQVNRRLACKRQWAAARTDGRFDASKLGSKSVCAAPTREQVDKESDERWNRIFAAKFADPDYYGMRVPMLQSSFGAFASQMEMLCQ
jgi:hypothetical protein